MQHSYCSTAVKWLLSRVAQSQPARRERSISKQMSYLHSNQRTPPMFCNCHWFLQLHFNTCDVACNIPLAYQRCAKCMQNSNPTHTHNTYNYYAKSYEDGILHRSIKFLRYANLFAKLHRLHMALCWHKFPHEESGPILAEILLFPWFLSFMAAALDLGSFPACSKHIKCLGLGLVMDLEWVERDARFGFHFHSL